jgi:hypothetical protein
MIEMAGYKLYRYSLVDEETGIFLFVRKTERYGWIHLLLKNCEIDFNTGILLREAMVLCGHEDAQHITPFVSKEEHDRRLLYAHIGRDEAYTRRIHRTMTDSYVSVAWSIVATSLSQKGLPIEEFTIAVI